MRRDGDPEHRGEPPPHDTVTRGLSTAGSTASAGSTTSAWAPTIRTMSVFALGCLLAFAGSYLAASTSDSMGERAFSPGALEAPTELQAQNALELTAIHRAPVEPGPLVTLETVSPVASYTLRATLDVAKHEVEGEGTIRFENSSEVSKEELYVHLYLNAFESDATVFTRKDGTGFRGTSGLSRFGGIEIERFFVREMGAEVWHVGATTEGDAKDRTDIRVPLPRPIAPGEVIHVDVRFKSTLPSVLLRTGFEGSFHMVGQWFPKLAKLEPDGRWAHFPFERFSEFYADFGDYDVTLDVPDGFTTGATGTLVESHDTSGRRISRYRASGVHDFAFTAWDGFREKTADADGVAIRCLFPAGYEAAASREIDSARAGLAYYGEAFGAYPYPNLTIVHPPEVAAEAGGMEYPTLITTGGPWWLAHSGSRAIELLTLHELAHQWFYGLVATNENASPFLDEGLTTFASGEAATALYGDHALVDWVPVSLAAGERLYARGVAARSPVASRAGAFRTGSDYAQLVYYRTATILRTIDRAFPSVAMRAVSRYARENRFGHPGPPELLAAFESEGGKEVAETLRGALFDRQTVNFRADPFDPGARAAVIHRDGALVFPVDIDVIDVLGAKHRTVWDGRGASTEIATTSPILAVVVDPQGKILLDENILDNGATHEPSLTPRVFFAGFFAFGIISSGVLP